MLLIQVAVGARASMLLACGLERRKDLWVSILKTRKL
jgi:hypothetical protein